MERNNRLYKIKVNKSFFDKKNLNKSDNDTNLNNNFKKSILYNFKFKPEIVINQFNKISNDIKANNELNKHFKKKSESHSRNDNENYSFNFSLNHYHHSFDDFGTNIKEDETLSPFSSRIRTTYYEPRMHNYKKIKFNYIIKPKAKLSDYIIKNPFEKINTNNFIRPKVDRNLKKNKFNINNYYIFDTESKIYSNERKIITKRKNLSQETRKISNKNFYYVNTEIYNSNHKSESNNEEDWIDIKLTNYRIKIFNQFYIHFEKFYKVFLKKIKFDFFKKLLYYNKDDYEEINSFDSMYNKIIMNYNSYTSKRIYNEKKKKIDIGKLSTMNNYYNLYKNKNINLSIKPLIIGYPLQKENHYNSIQSDYKRNAKLINLSPKNNIYMNTFSQRSHLDDKNILDTELKSPRLKIGNKIIINKDINFGYEGEQKGNELFRNLKELNNKNEQITKRKTSKIIKTEQNLDNIEMKNLNNGNKNKIKHTKEYNQFFKLRKEKIDNLKNNLKQDKAKNSRNRNSNMNQTYKYNKTFYNYLRAIGKESINKKYETISINNKNKKSNINNNKKIVINNKIFQTINKINNIIKFNNSKNIKGKNITEIKSKDNRIHLAIPNNNYLSKNKSSNIKYDLLNYSKNISMNITSNFKTNINNDKKLNEQLSAIKEEDISNKNSKKFEDSIKLIQSFDMNIINQKKDFISQFINIIETILINYYKRILILKIKTINFVNKMNSILSNKNNKKIIIHKKNKSTQIYKRKKGINKTLENIKSEET